MSTVEAIPLQRGDCHIHFTEADIDAEHGDVMATHEPKVVLTAAQVGPLPKPVSHHEPLLPPKVSRLTPGMRPGWPIPTGCWILWLLV